MAGGLNHLRIIDSCFKGEHENVSEKMSFSKIEQLYTPLPCSVQKKHSESNSFKKVTQIKNFRELS